MITSAIDLLTITIIFVLFAITCGVIMAYIDYKKEKEQ